jgi:hypothetical protein
MPPSLTRRRDLDRPLNADEFDADIDNLDDRVTAIEDDPPAAVSISSITASGDQLTITLSDASSYTVTMPYRRLNPRTWSPGAVLAVDDVFPQNGSLYVVIYPHTAGATFSAGANDGFGHDFYFALLPNPGNSLPDGGELGQVLQKLSSTNYHVGWRFIDAINVTFSPSSDSDLASDTVAAALEELEARIVSAVGAVSFDAIDISYSPSSASGLASSNVGDAIDELGERALAFADLTGTISAAQRDATSSALGTTGTISLDPTLGDVFTVTPSGDITLNAASAPANAKITLIVTTSGTSSHNITPGANFKSTGALATGTVNDKTFSISFVGDGSSLVETGRTTAM